jgi:hypothetical protein
MVGASENPACQPKSLMKMLKLTLVLTLTFSKKNNYPNFEPVTPPQKIMHGCMQYFIVKRHGNISMEIVLAPNENSGKISMHQE